MCSYAKRLDEHTGINSDRLLPGGHLQNLGC